MRVAGDEKVDFLAGMFTGIAFFADEIDGAHEGWECGESVALADVSVNAA